MLTHLDANNQPGMVNVGGKAVTAREAEAVAEVVLPPTLARLLEGNEIVGKKGPIFQTARLAGIIGAKRTSELIPLCHPLALEDCRVTLTARAPEQDGTVVVEVRCVASLHGKTGVEMEALTGATVAALTLYDMGKAVSHEIVIRDVRLVRKTGGKTDYAADANPA
ncbi:MAG TPA: cyclic pyranopterin monophosphate synthase MoaC [Candidatus Synoicihabitans sp.]|nr:cyclic pyranopterin monophosphate synthase MoaC [Candidatus Synoicihabitans sp.]